MCRLGWLTFLAHPVHTYFISNTAVTLVADPFPGSKHVAYLHYLEEQLRNLLHAAWAADRNISVVVRT